ncbi:MAG: ankyrin repeat domain-containing protein, partial [Candidatus Atribacteria bacterium]|nr:ankyrin repeat domain-containing protein [Candidatus Atribacteria bacterium]
ADVNARDKDGRTVLMWAAAYNQNPEVITTLIKAGADAKIVDNHGKKAIDYAEENEKLKGSSAYWELNDASY